MTNKLADMAAELEKHNATLAKLTMRARAITDRAETAVKQLKRGNSVRDMDFETDFRAIGADLIATSNAMEDFWKIAGDTVRHAHGNANIDELGAREFAARARQTKDLITEFSSAFHYLQSRCAGLSMRLNWLTLETNAEALSRLAPKIMVLMRELSKISDQASLDERSRSSRDSA